MKFSGTNAVIVIYFSDLTEVAKRTFLEAMNLTCAEEGNYDIYPIAEIGLPQDEEDDEL